MIKTTISTKRQREERSCERNPGRVPLTFHFRAVRGQQKSTGRNLSIFHGGEEGILTSPAQEPPAAVGLRHARLRAGALCRVSRGEASHLPPSANKKPTLSGRPRQGGRFEGVITSIKEYGNRRDRCCAVTPVLSLGFCGVKSDVRYTREQRSLSCNACVRSFPTNESLLIYSSPTNTRIKRVPSSS